MGKDELTSALYWLPWIKWAKFWAGVLVAVGIAGEIIGDRLAAPLEKIIEDAREAQIAQLNNESQAFRLKAAELEKQLAPRSLTSEQQRRIVDKLKIYAGQRFSLDVYDDPEALNLLTVIRRILTAAGWVQIGSQIGDVELGGAGMVTENNVKIEGPPTAVGLIERVKALDAALNAEGITSIPHSNPQLKDPSAINVVVGKKS